MTSTSIIPGSVLVYRPSPWRVPQLWPGSSDGSDCHASRHWSGGYPLSGPCYHGDGAQRCKPSHRHDISPPDYWLVIFHILLVIFNNLGHSISSIWKLFLIVFYKRLLIINHWGRYSGLKLLDVLLALYMMDSCSLVLQSPPLPIICLSLKTVIYFTRRQIDVLRSPWSGLPYLRLDRALKRVWC